MAGWKKGPTHSPTLVSLQHQVRMAERSKALRSGRSPLLWAWVRIPLLTTNFFSPLPCTESRVAQWKRAGPITQRSVDRNYALLAFFFVSNTIWQKKRRARPGFEPGTSRTLSENHTPRPTSRACSQHNSNWCPSMLTPLLLGHSFGCISNSLRYGLVVRISGSHPGGPGSIPGNGKLFSTIFCRQELPP